MPDRLGQQRLRLFIAKWTGRRVREKAVAQAFFVDLCDALGTPRPSPTGSFVFERWRRGRTPDAPLCADIDKRDCFIAGFRLQGELEPAFDALLDQYEQLGSERPPLLMLIDVSHCFWIWPGFDGEVPRFRSARRIELQFATLAQGRQAETLRDCFEAPARLDLRRHRRELTEQLALHLAELVDRLRRKHEPRAVADFVILLVFCLFADALGLLPTGLVRALATGAAETRAADFHELFEAMRAGSRFREYELVAFGDTLIPTTPSLPLNAEERDLLARLAELEWRQVDPAVFGTLVESALVGPERRRHGIHYTPRAFVERLVAITLEPLEQRWLALQAELGHARAQLNAVGPARTSELRRLARLLVPFHHELLRLRVLDPACGSGNFLIVAYERVRAIEHECHLLRASLLSPRASLAMRGQGVRPEQFLGLERDPWAAQLAQLALFVAHIQGRELSKLTKLTKLTKLIRSCQSSILGGVDALLDGAAPRPWPPADYVIGNPPFVGNKQMRGGQGHPYVEALRAAYPEVPKSAELAMYWWHRGAQMVARGEAKRMAMITTNSIRQVHNRQVVELALGGQSPVRIVWAIADHPWFARGAQVRVAMTVVERADAHAALPALLGEVTNEELEPPAVEFEALDRIHADLRGGKLDLTRAQPLRANAGLCFQGMNLVCKSGFVLDSNSSLRSSSLVRPYLGGREFLHERRGEFVIDAYGLTEEQLREQHPRVYAWLREHVLPVRRTNARQSYRDRWWIFGEPRKSLRQALAPLQGFIVTCETARYRTFERCESGTVPDHQLYAIADNDDFVLGVLLSWVHRVWVEAKASRHGVGNDPRYRSTECFATFPFPDPDPPLRERIATLARAIDLGRKALREFDPSWTLARVHELLERSRQCRRGELAHSFTAKERSLFLQLYVDWLALENKVAAAYELAHVHVVTSNDPSLAGCTGLERALSKDELLADLLRLNQARARLEP